MEKINNEYITKLVSENKRLYEQHLMKNNLSRESYPYNENEATIAIANIIAHKVAERMLEKGMEMAAQKLPDDTPLGVYRAMTEKTSIGRTEELLKKVGVDIQP